MSEALLCLNLAPELELEVIDWLLAQSDIDGFTSLPCYGHGRRHALLSVAERVAGKTRRVQLQVQLPEPRCPPLLAALQEAFGGSDMVYWVLPVLASGALDGAP